MSSTAYEVLGVAPGATPSELKAAFRRRARELHPDLHPADPEATRRFQELNEAYRAVSTGQPDGPPSPDPSPAGSRSWPEAGAAHAATMELPAIRILARDCSWPVLRVIELSQPAELVQTWGGWWAVLPDARDQRRFLLKVYPAAMTGVTEHAVLLFRERDQRVTLPFSATKVRRARRPVARPV